VTARRPGTPAFALDADGAVWLTGASLASVSTRLTDGRTLDHTATNERQAASFAPFGESPGPGNRLLLGLEGPIGAGLDPGAGPATIAIGAEVEPFPGAPPEAPSGQPGPATACLSARFRAEGGRAQPARILHDGTAAFAARASCCSACRPEFRGRRRPPSSWSWRRAASPCRPASYGWR
jgi:hypothetical protein